MTAGAPLAPTPRMTARHTARPRGECPIAVEEHHIELPDSAPAGESEASRLSGSDTSDRSPRNELTAADRHRIGPVTEQEIIAFVVGFRTSTSTPPPRATAHPRVPGATR